MPADFTSDDPVATALADLPPGRGRKVVVAMSGGVDSSVAALLLQRAGYEVVGCFMRLGSPDEPEVIDEATADAATSCRTAPRRHKQGCCSVNDAADARLVAARLGIPLYVLNFRREFGRIMDYFVAEYNAGRTPNPCVRCNDWLKFGRLHSYAASIDADFVASGHYARIQHDPGTHNPGTHNPGTHSPRPRLLPGLDDAKDQSYVLFGVRRPQIDHMLLPVGGLRKAAVRDIARDHDLPVFNKPDSQEICFVPDQDYAGLIQRRDPDALAPGEIVDTQGRVVGEHAGHQHYTIGQCRGLSVRPSGPRSVPLYVLDRDPHANTVTVGPKDQLFAAGCFAGDATWHLPPDEAVRRLQANHDGWIACHVKVRYNSPATPGRVRVKPEGHAAQVVDTQAANANANADIDPGHTDHPDLEIAFDRPVESVTPGQAVVCYEPAGPVLCGGWIDRAVMRD